MFASIDGSSRAQSARMRLREVRPPHEYASRWRPARVRGPVEARDAVTGDAGGRRVAEERLRAGAADAVHADLGEPAELDGCGHQPGGSLIERLAA